MLCSVEGILDLSFPPSSWCWPSSHPQVTGGSGWIQFGSRILKHEPESLQVKLRGSGWSLAHRACWLSSLLDSIRENSTHRQQLHFPVCRMHEMWAQQGWRPAEDPGGKLSALEDSEQILEAGRLLSCEPWFQGLQCRRELLGPIPWHSLVFFSPFNTLF